MWRSRFAGDPNVIGRSVTLDDRSFTVVGVMPEAFQFPYGAASVLRSAMTESRVDVWIAEYRPLRGRLSRLVARLKPGVTADAAAAEIAAVGDASPILDTGAAARARARRAVCRRGARSDAPRRCGCSSVPWRWCSIAACANVANLLLALTSSRMQEVATRAALGASRARLVRQFMIESLLLALAGGLAGVLVARWTSNLLVAFGCAAHSARARGRVRLDRLRVPAARVRRDGAVLRHCAGAGRGRVDAGMVAKEAGRATAGRRYGRVRDALVVAEVALAFVLASGAGLVIGEMTRLRESDNGMVTANVVTVPSWPADDAGDRIAVLRHRRACGAGSRCAAAGFTQVLPLQNWGWWSSSTDFFVKGAPPRHEAPFSIELRYVTPGYFEALGIPIRGGRGIETTDTRTAPRVILINETLARTYFGTADPVGVETNRGRIVGVVGDVRQVELGRPSVPEIYFPIAQNWSQVADLGMTLVVRTAGNPNAVIDAVRSRVLEVNPRIAIFNVRTMEQVVSDSLWNLNLYRWLMGWFAVLTLILSAVGLYGVMSYSVTSRRREWAVRLALGSAPADVARIVLMRGIALAAIGVSAGVALTLLAIRALRCRVFRHRVQRQRARSSRPSRRRCSRLRSAPRGCRRFAWVASRQRRRCALNRAGIEGLGIRDRGLAMWKCATQA